MDIGCKGFSTSACSLVISCARNIYIYMRVFFNNTFDHFCYKYYTIITPLCHCQLSLKKDAANKTGYKIQIVS